VKAHKALSLAGLAARAGKVMSGEFAVDKAIKTGKAFLVIAAEDASDNTRKKFLNSCKYYQIPFRICSDKETLGHAIGRQERAVIAISDRGLAEAVRKVLPEEAGSGNTIEE